MRDLELKQPAGEFLRLVGQGDQRAFARPYEHERGSARVDRAVEGKQEQERVRRRLDRLHQAYPVLGVAT
ncbi:hypothetical protein ACIBG8_01630 [Nonomuraea sp. NPDC050556]|uniref:hypothetical protein n=1 Tax=Nonomuraea sp. NPDC050556 TaxID=3364369 RepID=UPI0037A12E6C